MMKITSTDAQNNFGKYLKFAEAGEEIIITRNNKEIAKVIKSDRNTRMKEETAVYGSEHGSKVTYEEFLKMTKDSDLRYELIDGEVFLLASPSFTHQTAVMEISGRFYNWFKGTPCRPVVAPFDVTLIKFSEKNVVQPDILVICDTDKIDKKGKYKGTPALVVEVLSPSSKYHDIVRKLGLYTLTGVKEFWVVNTDSKEVTVYSFKNKDISEVINLKQKDIVKSLVFEGLEIPLEEIFE